MDQGRCWRGSWSREVILAQAAEELIGMPPPQDVESIASWWPYITLGASLLISAVATVWTTWTSYKTKKAETQYENQRAEAQKRFELETKRMELEFDRQKEFQDCLLYTSPSPRDQRGSRMPSSA